ARHRVAGVLFESVQGEGGVTPLTPDLALAMGRLTRSHGALLVADEVQTGVGRTGTFFGFEQDGLQPDIVTMAKGLGGGLPLGATLMAPKTAELLGPGSHGCTFGGNPVACAAGNAVLDVLDKDGLAARAGRFGKAFMAAVREEGSRSGVAIRGRGLLLGVPLVGPQAPETVERMRQAGYLVGQAGKSVVRLAPPLVIAEPDLLGAVKPLLESLSTVAVVKRP
ncbi:MAG TPA: aminotransferase class III-fold pyridoxal phosphate-dependent enzyme, partial [Candidatus Thermoplasmatota archaeon]|nr:aminotransferase class III-fold pyridoxal phosphate-dependent enzyme [Candidatus Thermoplasmatota archaeon]